MATRPEIITKKCLSSQTSFNLPCITDKVHSRTNDVIINIPPILLHINSDIDLRIMQQGSTNSVVPETSENLYHQLLHQSIREH